MSDSQNVILSLIDQHYQRLLTEWLACLKRDTRRGDAQREAEITRTGEAVPRAASPRRRERPVSTTSAAAEWAPMRELLEDMSRDRAVQGYSPSETAMFVFSLKEPLFELLRQELAADDADGSPSETWAASRLIDRLGLYTIECYARIREEVITRQQQELLELSTPVVELWDGILALPLIGTLDSARTQIVMESLLQRIVDHRGGDRHHRHHRRADRRHAGRAAPDQDRRGRAADGRRLHHQRHPPADRADDRAPRRRAERRVQGDAGRRVRARAAPLRPGGHGPQTARRAGRHSGWPRFPS